MMAAGQTQVRDLQADLAICEAATPGPWEIDEGDSDAFGAFDVDGEAVIYAAASPIAGVGLRGRKQDEANIKFCVEARTGWPYAIRRALEAEAEVDKLRNEISMLYEALNQRGCGL